MLSRFGGKQRAKSNSESQISTIFGLVTIIPQIDPNSYLSHVLIIFIPIGINSKDVYIALNPVQKCRDTDLQGMLFSYVFY
jgi:hypothetical protein